MTPTQRSKSKKSRSSSSPASRKSVPKAKSVSTQVDNESKQKKKSVFKRSTPRLMEFTPNSLWSIGDIFLNARSEKGWSLEDIEKVTGIPGSSISALERASRQSITLDVFMMLVRVLKPRKKNGEFYTLEELIEISMEENPFLEDLRDPELRSRSPFQNRLQATLHSHVRETGASLQELADKANLPVERVQVMFDGVSPKSITAAEAIKISSVLRNPYSPDHEWIAEDFIHFICQARLHQFNDHSQLQERLENLMNL